MPAEVPVIRSLPDAPRPLRSLYLSTAAPALTGRYIVKGLLLRDTLAEIYGPPGSGKTFLTADIGLHVASGREWRGHRVRRGLVCYLAAEGPASVLNRSIAWCAYHQVGRDLPFAICPEAVDLVFDRDRVLDWIGDAERTTGEGVAMVVVDTLSRSFGGRDENSAQDMAEYVAALDHLRENTGACILVVHHMGKDPTRKSRGSNVLPAATDTMVEVQDKVATVERLKDGEVGALYPFRLEPFELGIDEDGEPVTTCVAVASESSPQRKAPSMTPAERNVYDALHEVLDDRQRRREAPVALLSAGARMGQLVARIDDWRSTAYGRMGDLEQDTKRKQFRRAQQGLQAKGRIQQFEDFVWLP